MQNSATARPLDRTSPLPLWAQLHEDLTRRLSAGAFNTSFPGEMDLVAEYAVSRHTVREALRRMRDDGLLDSTRGRPTQVRRDIEQPLGALYSLFREVEARNMSQTSRVLAQRMVTDAEAAEALDLPADTPLFYLERLRLADNEPLAHDHVWLAGDVSPLLEVDFGHTALYDELRKITGAKLTDGTELVCAIVPPPLCRELLQVPEDVACLRLTRVGRLSGRAIEYRITVIRGDRFTMRSDWSSRGYTVAARTEAHPVPTDEPDAAE